ncbi:hypothetical protein CTAYLR_007877 [Chrysophaeum taylorii]|uniref:Uncharacterized protein n=1 Tax=Chrysophaeum taylorii TaxID=2483200 RepID=A0AAD7XK25_9STRA|nr:hypothetical protein CTAYLR_007877 [Chrysophaeum taylorii]
MPFSNVYESVVTAALSASLVSLILLDARSIQQIVDKLRLFTMGLLFMLFGRDKRWKRRPPDSATVSAFRGDACVGSTWFDTESEWNLIFNKGSKLLLPFKAIAALDRFVIQDNDAPKQQKRVHVLSSLQEVSTNVDTVSLLAPHATPTLPRVPELLQAPARFEVVYKGFDSKVKLPFPNKAQGRLTPSVRATLELFSRALWCAGA